MVRNKLAAAILSAGLLLPGFAFALGVGEYTLKSYLNQPLDLEVELIQTKDLAPEEVIATIASQEEFARVGVERVFFLSDIRFEIEQRGDGRLVVVARSTKPVTEPFLNFLMEVQWPQGRMLREYTILLDPPLYKTGVAPTAMSEPVVVLAPPPAVAAEPIVEPVAESAVPASDVASSAVATPVLALPPADNSLPPPPSSVVAGAVESQPVAAPTPTQALQPAAAEGEYRVQARDTMWEIAARHRGGANVQQTMMAIQRANEGAFIKGNINLVKKGYVLRIPAETEIQQISTAEARSAFTAQNRAWRELLDSRAAALPSEGAQLEAGKAATGKRSAKKGTGAGEVTLVAPTASAKSGKAAGGKELDALQSQLAIAEEGLDKAARENKELASRLADLGQQVQASDKLLAMKNTQIADLQKELNRLRKEKGMPPVEAPQSVTETAVAGTAAAAAESTVVPEPAANKVVEPEQSKPAKKEIKKKPEQVSGNTSGSSMLLPLAGLATLLIGGIGFWFWRRKKGADASGSTGYAIEETHEAQIAEDMAQLQDLNLGDNDASDLDDADHATTRAKEGGESADPLGEADMYMAYGRFQHAADILYAALQREPERDEIRVKLAEVYAEMGDADSAREQATAVASSKNADIRRQAAAVLARVGGSATSATAGAAAEEKLPSLDDLALEFSGGKQEPVAREELSFDMPADIAAPSVVDNALDFSLGDFSSDAGSKTGVRPKAAVNVNAEEMSLDDVDFGEFTLEEEKPVAAATEEFLLEDELSLEAAGANVSDEEINFAAEPAAVEEPVELTLEEEVAAAGELDLESELADLQADLADEGAGGEAAVTGGDDFDFLADSDENATKLDLARAYIDMGDAEGARDILNEVVAEGKPAQKAEAQKLLASVG